MAVVTAPSTPRFTEDDVAMATAKRIARVGDFDSNVTRPFAAHGIELREPGAFTVVAGTQQFRVAVTELGGAR